MLPVLSAPHTRPMLVTRTVAQALDIRSAAVYARKFGVSLEWLLTGRGGMGAKIENSELAEIIEMLRDASPEVLTAVRTLLEQQLAPVSFGSAAFERTK